MRRHIEDVQLNYRKMLSEMGMIEWGETRYSKESEARWDSRGIQRYSNGTHVLHHKA
jgi:hypothetical protein